MKNTIKILLASSALLFTGCNAIECNKMQASSKYACSDCENKMKSIQDSNDQLLSENSSLRNQLEVANEEISTNESKKAPFFLVVLIFIGCFAAGFALSRKMNSAKKV